MPSKKESYISEIVEWNKKINLTGLKLADDISFKLYDDSLNISKAVDLTKNVSIVDIGCGAGFPGIPLKIEYPNISLTLIDSVGKKIDFVKHVIELLELQNTRAVCERAEDAANDLREQFDVAVSRAVAQLNILSEYCLPFVKVGGLFIAQKGPNIEAELASAKHAIEMLGGRMKEKTSVPSGYLLVIEKIRHTPKEFPRKTGIPAKNPL